MAEHVRIQGRGPSEHRNQIKSQPSSFEKLKIVLDINNTNFLGLTNLQRKICLIPNVEREDSDTPEHHGTAKEEDGDSFIRRTHLA